jgi:uncharacterized protein (TIGR00251 family)
MILKIKVKPNSKKAPKVEKNADNLVIFAKNRAVENKVNKEVIKILAKYFDIAPSKIMITKGLKSRNKTIEIADS